MQRDATARRMRRTVCALICLACVTFSLSPQAALSQALCSGLKPTREFALCVQDAATFQCRSSQSLQELQACFARAARGMLGDRANEVAQWTGGLKPDCTGWFLPGLFACSLHGGEWGAPEEWCYRSDANTINWCEGDPPNHKCKKISCPLSTCIASTAFTRCGMVWNPAAK
jgi:hypothetical protein